MIFKNCITFMYFRVCDDEGVQWVHVYHGLCVESEEGCRNWLYWSIKLRSQSLVAETLTYLLSHFTGPMIFSDNSWK